ncbi:MAG: peptidylprolyl isomerase [Planctomycetota bacterium]|nr:peptidylprolyl isomerase [Planctomycetota bacterium]
MLSKARLLILAAPVLFLTAVLSGCGSSEKVSVAAAVTTPASPEKPPAEKEARAGAPAGGTLGIEDNRTGGIAAIVGNKVISRSRLRKKVDQRILAIVARQQVAPAAINRRQQELPILSEMVNRELILQAQMAVYPGKEIGDLVVLDNVMAWIDREIQNRRKAGQKEVTTRQDYFDLQKNEMGLSREEVVREIREKMLSEMYLWQEVYGKLDTFVSPSESRAYYRSHREEFTPPQEVHYQRIKIFDNADAFAAVQGVRQGLQEGKAFSALAMAHSEEFQGNPKLRATVFKNKFSELDDFPFPIPVILKGLREGQHSGPDRAQGAFWFFRMKEIIKGEPRTYKEAQGAIENRLLVARRKIAYGHLIEKLKSSTRVEVYLGTQAAAARPQKPVGPVLAPKPEKKEPAVPAGS